MTVGAISESTVDLPAGPVRVREAGDGSPVVLVHGALVNGHLWDDVIPLLADRHRVVAPDLPMGGHAHPLAPDTPLGLPGQARIVADLLEALGLDDVTLVGNDTGGGVCQVVVTRHPERVGRLVLTSCDAFDNCPPAFFRFLVWGAYVPGSVWLTAQLMRSPRLAGLPISFGRLTRRGFARERLDRMFGPARRSAGVRRDATRMLRSLDAADTRAAAAELPEVKVPVLLAWSVDDPIFPPGDADRLAELLPDVTVRPIADSLAFSPVDAPHDLARAIASFTPTPT